MHESAEKIPETSEEKPKDSISEKQLNGAARFIKGRFSNKKNKHVALALPVSIIVIYLWFSIVLQTGKFQWYIFIFMCFIKKVFCLSRRFQNKLQLLLMFTFQEIKWLVLDMSKIIYLDSTGGKLIAQLRKEYNEAGITLILASVSGKKSIATCFRLFETIGIIHLSHDISLFSYFMKITSVILQSGCLLYRKCIGELREMWHPEDNCYGTNLPFCPWCNYCPLVIRSVSCFKQ